MNWFKREQNPEILRERAEKLRRARVDLRGAGWAVLAAHLIHSWGAVALMGIMIGWRLAPELGAFTDGLSTNMDELFSAIAPLLSELLETDWYANAVAILTVVISLLGLIPMRVYARRRDIDLRPAMGLKDLGPGTIAALYLAMMGVNALGALGVMATEALFNWSGYSIYVDILTDDTPFSFRVTAVYAVLLAPFIEEYVYRGALLEGLSRYGERFGVMASAVIFGLAHGNLMQFLPAALIGWFLGYVRVKTGSWGVCVLLHALNNLTSLVLDDLMDRIADERVYTAVNLAYIAVMAIAFALVWRRLKTRYGELTEPEEPTGYGSLISAPALIYLYLVFQTLIANVTKLT